MIEKSIFRLSLTLLTAASISACMPRFYERTTVALETGSDEGVQVHFGELDSCLIRQLVPVEYIVRRPRYTLQIRPVPGLGSAPKLELRLQSDSGTVEMQFPDLIEPPPALYAEKGVRYLVETEALKSELSLVVLRGADELGREHYRLSPDHCRVLSPG